MLWIRVRRGKVIYMHTKKSLTPLGLDINQAKYSGHTGQRKLATDCMTSERQDTASLLKLMQQRGWELKGVNEPCNHTCTDGELGMHTVLIGKLSRHRIG